PVAGGTLTTSAAQTVISINAGNATINWQGNLTQAQNAALITINGANTGNVTFGGTLSATNGTGLQFDNADGTYHVNDSAGSLTLNGGDAGIDILNGSGGTFTFGRAAVHATLNNPTGTGFVANGSTAGVTYNGDITKNGASAGLVVDITNESAGTITFQNGTITNSSAA